MPKTTTLQYSFNQTNNQLRKKENFYLISNFHYHLSDNEFLFLFLVLCSFFFYLNSSNFWFWRLAAMTTGCSLKISNGKMGLVTYSCKHLFTTTILLIYLSFFLFLNYQPWISHSIKVVQLIKNKWIIKKNWNDPIKFKSLF